MAGVKQIVEIHDSLGGITAKVDQDEAFRLIGQGDRYSLAKPVRSLDPDDGEFRDFTTEEVRERAKAGRANPFAGPSAERQSKITSENIRKQQREIADDSGATAFFTGAASGATFGVSSLIAEKLAGQGAEEAMQTLSEESGNAMLAGEITGSLATIAASGGASLLGKGTATGAKLATAETAKATGRMLAGTGRLLPKATGLVAREALSSASFHIGHAVDTNKPLTAIGLAGDVALDLAIAGSVAKVGKAVGKFRAGRKLAKAASATEKGVAKAVGGVEEVVEGLAHAKPPLEEALIKAVGEEEAARTFQQADEAAKQVQKQFVDKPLQPIIEAYHPAVVDEMARLQELGAQGSTEALAQLEQLRYVDRAFTRVKELGLRTTATEFEKAAGDVSKVLAEPKAFRGNVRGMIPTYQNKSAGGIITTVKGAVDETASATDNFITSLDDYDDFMADMNLIDELFETLPKVDDAFTTAPKVAETVVEGGVEKVVENTPKITTTSLLANNARAELGKYLEQLPKVGGKNNIRKSTQLAGKVALNVATMGTPIMAELSNSMLAVVTKTLEELPTRTAKTAATAKIASKRLLPLFMLRDGLAAGIKSQTFHKSLGKAATTKAEILPSDLLNIYQNIGSSSSEEGQLSNLERMGEILGDDPQLAVASMEQEQRRLAFLREEIPQPKNAMFGNRQPYDGVHPSEIRKFSRVYHAANNPEELISQILDRELDADTVRTVRTVHPEYFNEIVLTLAEAVENSPKIGVKMRVLLSQLVGGDIGSGRTPGAMIAMDFAGQSVGQSKAQKQRGGIPQSFGAGMEANSSRIAKL